MSFVGNVGQAVAVEGAIGLGKGILRAFGVSVRTPKFLKRGPKGARPKARPRPRATAHRARGSW